MQQSASIEQQLHDSGVSLLRRNMQRSQPFAVAFVDYESSLFRVQKLLYRVVSAVTCRKVQWRLVVVVLQVDASAEANQILERPNVALA